jgi:hypothetical protein
VRIALSHPEADFLHMGRLVINKCLEKMGPIHCGPLLRDCGISLTHSRLKSAKNRSGPIAWVLCGIASWFPWLSRERSTAFATPLGRHGLETPLGTRRVRRFFSEVSDFFHVADTGRLLRRWKTPCLLLPGLQRIFFQVRRRVAWATASTSSHATI